MTLTLRQLTIDDEAAFFEGLEEWQGEELDWYTFSWKPGMPYLEMLAILIKENAGIDLRPDRVPHSMLYGFVDGKIIGRVSVRHHLNEALRRRNGHLGYAVAPRFRKKGYATEMLAQGLEYCRDLKLSEVMISCSETNTASWKTIEKFNARLDEKFWDDEDQEMCRRYWIKL